MKKERKPRKTLKTGEQICHSLSAALKQIGVNKFKPYLRSPKGIFLIPACSVLLYFAVNCGVIFMLWCYFRAVVLFFKQWAKAKAAKQQGVSNQTRAGKKT